MEIRALKKDIKIFQKYKLPENWVLTEDNTIKESVIMIYNDGKLIEWTRGKNNVLSFLKYGYVRIIKNCPHRWGKCIGEKCSLYVIMNGTGDCAHVWNVMKNN